MNVEKTDKEVIELTIPNSLTDCPTMIETVGTQVDSPKNATQPQGVPAPEAGKSLADININKPPVGTPV